MKRKIWGAMAALVLITTGVFISTPATAAPGTDAAQLEAQVAERIQLIKETRRDGKLKEEDDLWSKSLKELPQSSRLRTAYIMHLIDKNQFAQAKTLCAAALQDFPDNQNLKVFRTALEKLSLAKSTDDIKKAKDDMIIDLLDITNTNPRE